MQFRIADTFTDSLAKLSSDEQKAVKTTAFDLQMNPAHPGLRFHKLDRAKDKRFASVSVNMDLRLIVHKSADNFLLCYVDHHDKAYAWAERRKLETHPKTGAAQLVEVRETVREIVVPSYVAEEPAPKPKLFESYAAEDLLRYGVPEEWVADVLEADEDQLLALSDHLPAEAAEALLELAVGATPAEPLPVPADPFAHPDAQRRFRVMHNVEELEQALDYPWEKWTIFLHPQQRDKVEKRFNGPARVAGSAGTGKTIVALHRAVFLARNYPEARVLLTTFSEPLAQALRIKLRRLLIPEPRLSERLEVHALQDLGEKLYQLYEGPLRLASRAQLRELLQAASQKVAPGTFSPSFLQSEWEQVVDAWQLEDWEAYRDVVRLGRKTRLPERKRVLLWEIFTQVRAQLQAAGLITASGMFSVLAQKIQAMAHPPYEYAVVDEAQDIGVAQLRFLAAMAGDRPDGLFFAGDLGQRIFQQPFSWSSLGVSVRGRARTLRINYRTSHQIRRQADLLLGPELADVDGVVEDRRGTVSVFNGPAPQLEHWDSFEEESAGVARWLQARREEGIAPHEMGMFVRSETELPRAIAAAEAAGLRYQVLDEHLKVQADQLSISTMHLAKGLEFRAVAVMACDDEVIPAMARIEAIGDEADLDEVYQTERHLLYVACTRARDRLLVSSGDLPSEFLEDLQEKGRR